MDREILSHCVGPLSQEYLSRLPHNVAPCMNLHRVLPSKDMTDNISSRLLSKPSPFSSSFPTPLTPLTKLTLEELNGYDPTTKLVREKIKWQLKKEKILKTVFKEKDKYNRKIIRRVAKVRVNSHALVPQGVTLVAQHLDRDPDPNFFGAYNWYYTGGTLATLEHQEHQYLLRAIRSKLRYSQIIGGNLNELSSFDLNSDDPIYQIVSNSRGAAVSQKSHVSILSTSETESDGFQLHQVHSVSDKKYSFVSVALPPNSIKKYCTLSNHGVLKLWDLESSKSCKVKVHMEPGKGIKVTDRWSRLHFHNKRSLLLADRCCLHVLDVRKGMTENGLAWCPKKITEHCEELSYVVSSSVRDHVVYLTTSHQVLTLDLRFGFCQRWTHMMAAPPYLGFTRPMSHGDELVCLGSQVPSDCVMVVNAWKDEEPESLYRPTRLLSPAQGLHLARQNALCLDPTLTSRVTSSMTGLACLPSDVGLNVLRQSATADVFIQQLLSSDKDPSQLTVKDLAAYSEWCQPTLSLDREPATLTVTAVNDFSSVFKALILDKPLVKTNEKDNTVMDGAWQVSKKYLEDCVDMLAGRMLAVWEVEEEDEWAAPVEQSSCETILEQDPAEKVMNWLDATNPASTLNDKVIKDVGPTKPDKPVTSTPLPLSVVEQEPSPADPSPWMTQCFQVPQYTPHHNPLSPPSSEGTSKHRRKKQKMLDDHLVATPKNKQADAKKQQRSSQKKFIPGF